jgi:hypothetical protein
VVVRATDDNRRKGRYRTHLCVHSVTARDTTASPARGDTAVSPPPVSAAGLCRPRSLPSLELLSVCRRLSGSGGEWRRGEGGGGVELLSFGREAEREGERGDPPAVRHGHNLAHPHERRLDPPWVCVPETGACEAGCGVYDTVVQRGG